MSYAVARRRAFGATDPFDADCSYKRPTGPYNCLWRDNSIVPFLRDPRLLDPFTCAALVQNALTRAQDPYWSLPVPSPAEAAVLQFAIAAGLLTEAARGQCQVVLARDGIDRSAIAGYQQTCASGSLDRFSQQFCADLQRRVALATYPFASWLRDTAGSRMGVVIANRVYGSDGQWDVARATFVAATREDFPIDDTLASVAGVGALPAGVLPALRAFVAATTMLARGEQGLLGESRNWMVVYAPVLTNLPGVS